MLVTSSQQAGPWCGDRSPPGAEGLVVGRWISSGQMGIHKHCGDFGALDSKRDEAKDLLKEVFLSYTSRVL